MREAQNCTFLPGTIPPLLAILQPHLGYLGWREPRYQEKVYLNMISECISTETCQEPIFLSYSTKFIFIQLNEGL